MYQLNLCDRVTIFLSDNGEQRWPINPRDRVRRRFLILNPVIIKQVKTRR